MGELTAMAIIIGIIHSGIRLATPYLFAALGETISQRSGVLNLGTEGVMLMGAFFGFYVTFTTGNPWLGVLTAAFVGVLMGLLMSVVSVTFQAEQGISGIGLSLFGLGVSSMLFKTMLGTVEGVKGFSELTFCVSSSFCLSDLPVVGNIFFNHSILTYAAFLLVPIVTYVLNKTTWGLKVRAVGQNPGSGRLVGRQREQNALRRRHARVSLSGHCRRIVIHFTPGHLPGKHDQRYRLYRRRPCLFWRLVARWRDGGGAAFQFGQRASTVGTSPQLTHPLRCSRHVTLCAYHRGAGNSIPARAATRCTHKTL